MIEEMKILAQGPHITPAQFVELVSLDCHRLPRCHLEEQFYAHLSVLKRQRDTYELDDRILAQIENIDPYACPSNFDFCKEMNSDVLLEIASLLSQSLNKEQLRIQFNAQLDRCIRRGVSASAAFPPETIELIHEMERKGRSNYPITPEDLFLLCSIKPITDFYTVMSSEGELTHHIVNR
jgi:hypothetical protein